MIPVLAHSCHARNVRLNRRCLLALLPVVSAVLPCPAYAGEALEASGRTHKAPAADAAGESVKALLQAVSWPRQAEGGTGAAASAAPRRPGILLVDIEINGVKLPEPAEAEVLADGRVALPEAIWTLLRLRPPAEHVALSDGSSGYALESVENLRYTLDPGHLSLAITAEVAAFEESRLAAQSQDIARPTQSAAGAYLNYDMTLTAIDNGKVILGGALRAVGFKGGNSLVMEAAITTSPEGRTKVVRTETALQRDLPESRTTIVAGDTISGNGGWSRPVRFGGVRISSDFSLDPLFITYPMFAISGSAALPSTVDVLVNNSIRERQMPLNPGPFSITNLPSVTGAGQVNLIVRDLRGVETVLSRDFYFAPRLLAPGLNAFSFEAGAMRRNFGIKDNDYGPVFAAASWRRGFTPTLTVEGRVELQGTRQAAGVELDGTIAALLAYRASASFARSTASAPGGARTGGHYLIGAEHQEHGFGLTAQWEHFDRGFEQFGSLGGEIMPRDRLSVGGSISLPRFASLGARYIEQSSWSGDRYRIVAGNLGVALPHGMRLDAYVSNRLDRGDKGWSGGVSLIVRFGRNGTAGSNIARSEDGRISTLLSANRSPPPGPGIGWHVRASANGEQSIQGGVVINTAAGQFSGDADIREGSSAIRLAARGAIGWFGGLPFATREINGNSFAVVRVADVAGVRIFRNNQYAGSTNAKGLALITGLLPYQRNRLTLQPDEMPFNLEIKGSEQTPVPFARAGVLVDFPVTRSMNALVTLLLPDGQVMPLGAKVTSASGREFIVGRGGEAYLSELSADNTFSVRWATGSCRLHFSLPAQNVEEARLGPVRCGDPQ